MKLELGGARSIEQALDQLGQDVLVGATARADRGRHRGTFQR